MSPKKRSNKNTDLTGTHITPKKRSDGPGTYTEYRYHMPAIMPDGTAPNKKTVSLGTDRQKAIEAAHQLNEHLRPSGAITERIISTTRKPAVALDSISKLIAEFKTNWIPDRHYSDTTLAGKLIQLRTYEQHWGNDSTAAITTSTIADFLDPLTAEAYRKHRATLLHLFTFATHRGYRDHNPVIATLTKRAPKKQRKEHTLEGWKQIHQAAPDWLKRTMDIALLSLQRPSDLVGMQTSHVNLDKKTITILQDKTRNYAKPVFIEIEMGDDLHTAIKACYKTGVLCPYLIHYQPTRMSRKHQDAKPHSFAVTRSHLTKTFAKVRDECGAYNHIPKGQRPGIHAARGLGSWLYEKAGYPKDYIMALTGHSTEAMLQHYIDGHEEPQPVQVSAGLSLKQHKE